MVINWSFVVVISPAKIVKSFKFQVSVQCFLLQSCTRNWNAFDDEGIACIVESCPQLEVLLLDRAEPLGLKLWYRVALHTKLG